MVMLLSVARSWAGFHSIPHSSNDDARVSALVLPLLPHADLLGTGQPGTANSFSMSNSQNTCNHTEHLLTAMEKDGVVCALLIPHIHPHTGHSTSTLWVLRATASGYVWWHPSPQRRGCPSYVPSCKWEWCCFPLPASHWSNPLCAPLSTVPISYLLVLLVPQEKNLVGPCAVFVCWLEGTGGCPSMAARQGSLLRLHFAAPQALNMKNEVSHLHFSCVLAPCASQWQGELPSAPALAGAISDASSPCSRAASACAWGRRDTGLSDLPSPAVRLCGKHGDSSH